ncbi:MAG: ABC transporter permease [Betaproteobacteria bacterium]
MRRIGTALLVMWVVAALAAPWLAPHPPDVPIGTLSNAPPTLPHLVDGEGRWHAPFIYPLVLANRLEQRYEEDRSVRVPLAWLSGGHLVQSSDASRAPLVVAGTDPLARDVFSRLLYGARISLGLAGVAALGATVLGLLSGGLAGYAGGAVDELVMRATEFVLVLPVIYVALALRAVLPLVLTSSTIFLWLTGIFAVVGAPFVARGVRAIVRSERGREYAVAARSLGAGHVRILVRHLLPACTGFVVVQLTVLVPAYIVAEATLSYVGLGFPDSTPSWGAMLRDASNVQAMVQFPWLLVPAAAIFLVVLGLNLVLQGRSPGLGAGGAERLHYNEADGLLGRFRSAPHAF